MSEDKKPVLATVDCLPGKRWNSHAALGDAMQRASMDAPMIVIWLDGEKEEVRYAISNCKNKDTLFLAEYLRCLAMGLK